MLEKMKSGIQVRDQRREQILSAEAFMLSKEQVELEEPEHHFFEGGYGRELFIPANTYACGKIHKHRSLNILLQGELYLLTEEGVVRLKAPYTVVSKPGIKRVVYTVTDCKWLCVHGTQETDLELIEKDVIASDYSEVAQVTQDDILKINNIIKEDA